MLQQGRGTNEVARRRLGLHRTWTVGTLLCRVSSLDNLLEGLYNGLTMDWVM